jgi:hypothetical protein
VLGALGLAGTTAVALVVVLVAAQRPGPLLGHPAQHRLPGWMAGPLSGIAPSLGGNHGALRTGLVLALFALFACWLLVTAAARHMPMRLLAGVIAGVHVIWLLGPPLLLTDLFNYVHYARMGALHGLNPYSALPAADAGDPALPLANWHHMPSPYGPVFTLLTYPLALLPLPLAYWAWKLLVLAASLGVLALVWWLARRLGRSPQRAVAFAGLNPLVLLYGVGGAHNDAISMLPVLGAVALAASTWSPRGAPADAVARERRSAVLAGALVIFAAGVKLSAGALAPLVVLGTRRRAALAGAGVAAGVTGVIVLGVFGGHAPALGLQNHLVNALSAPQLAGALVFGQGGVTPAVRHVAEALLAAAVVAGAVAVMRDRTRLIEASGAVTLAAILTLSWTMPWYVGWLLPFAALSRRPWLGVAAVIVTVWLGLIGVPQWVPLVHGLGYHPWHTDVGWAAHEFEQRLVH